MSTWREAATSGRNMKRNTFLGIAGVFTLMTLITGDKSHFLTAPIALLFAYLFSARLEWRWEIPSRKKRGEVIPVLLIMKNRAFFHSIFKGDLVHEIAVRIETQSPLRVLEKDGKFFSSLEAGEERKIEFRLRSDPDAMPDLYGFTIESSSSAGKLNKYFEVYVYE